MYKNLHLEFDAEALECSSCTLVIDLPSEVQCNVRGEHELGSKNLPPIYAR